MRAAILHSPAGRFLYRHRALLLALALFSAYATAVPPSKTFGSHELEQIKDALALALVGIGLALRLAASGLRLERRDLQSPFHAANLVLLFGIFLMHGNFYVVALGAFICAAIHAVVRLGTRPEGMPWRTILRGGEPFHLGAALAREWPIIAASGCLLALTEAYEELGGGKAESLHHLIFGLSGVAVLVSAFVLAVELRRQRVRSGCRAIRRRAASSLGAGLLLDGRLRAAVPAPLHSPEIAGGRVGKRENETRWSAISTALESYEPRSILDVGCAEGWFLRRAADTFNCFGLGIDSYESRVMLGEAARLHGGDERVAIMKGKLKADDIRALPRFDAVICLSVLHWIIREEGLPAAQEFVRALLSRAERVLLFEIGEAEHFARRFSTLLPGDASGENFVRYLLATAGASNIRVIAESRDINDRKTRLLFAAEPPQATKRLTLVR